MTIEFTAEDDSYVPEPIHCADGECLLSDPVEFFELTHSLAAIVRDGALFVLRRDTMKWANVESITPPKPANVTSIRSVK